MYFRQNLSRDFPSFLANAEKKGFFAQKWPKIVIFVIFRPNLRHFGWKNGEKWKFGKIPPLSFRYHLDVCLKPYFMFFGQFLLSVLNFPRYSDFLRFFSKNRNFLRFCRWRGAKWSFWKKFFLLNYNHKVIYT